MNKILAFLTFLFCVNTAFGQGIPSSGGSSSSATEENEEDEKKVEDMEAGGANILILKGWGKSEMAERKIRQASIRAIGVDIKDSRT